MKIEAVVNKPDDVSFTMTMTLAEWKKLRASINQGSQSTVNTGLVLQFEQVCAESRGDRR